VQTFKGQHSSCSLTVHFQQYSKSDSYKEYFEVIYHRQAAWHCNGHDIGLANSMSFNSRPVLFHRTTDKLFTCVSLNSPSSIMWNWTKDGDVLHCSWEDNCSAGLVDNNSRHLPPGWLPGEWNKLWPRHLYEHGTTFHCNMLT